MGVLHRRIGRIGRIVRGSWEDQIPHWGFCIWGSNSVRYVMLIRPYCLLISRQVDIVYLRSHSSIESMFIIMTQTLVLLFKEYFCGVNYWIGIMEVLLGKHVFQSQKKIWGVSKILDPRREPENSKQTIRMCGLFAMKRIVV